MWLACPAVRRILALSLVVIAAACSSPQSEPATMATRPTTSTTGTPAILSSSTTTAVPLTTRQLFDTVSPSLAFITTDLGVGSGVLIDGGWVVTNAHVVWPFDDVRVVFPDGTEVASAPVVRADVYRDLAIVGPVNVDATPLELATDAEYGAGDTVYLIGYPGEVEEFPAPAITQGVISRVREWRPADITFIQTDALIAGGQSGGALVSATGEMLGVSGLGGFSEGNFALVAAAEDLGGVLDDLLAGETPDRFDIAPFVVAGGSTEHEVSLPSYWHDAIFVLREPVGTTVSIQVEGENHGVVVTDSLGYGVTTEEEAATSVEFVVEWDEPHFVFVTSVIPGPTTTTVTSSHPLVRWTDPDDDAVLGPGDTIEGVIDVSGEYDVYRLPLLEGETVRLTVDGLFDPTIYIDQVGTEEPLGYDFDGGGGLFGTNAQLTYTALAAGEYLVVVTDELLEPGGGYLLTVE